MRQVLVVDYEYCSGCHTCEIACQQEHGMDPDKYGIKLTQIGPDEIKPRIFDMFYSGANQIADSRRSLGLGLSLCKSIINAHGGELTVSDNLPHGTVFTFTLPAGEVKVYE